MAYNVKPPATNFENVPVGTYGARLLGIGHAGTQEDTYPGKKPKLQDKVYFTFELDAYMTDGRPFTLSKDYTFTFFDQGNLLPVIEALLQRRMTVAEIEEFDITQLIGKGAMVAVGSPLRESPRSSLSAPWLAARAVWGPLPWAPWRSGRSRSVRSPSGRWPSAGCASSGCISTN